MINFRGTRKLFRRQVPGWVIFGKWNGVDMQWLWVAVRRPLSVRHFWSNFVTGTVSVWCFGRWYFVDWCRTSVEASDWYAAWTFAYARLFSRHFPLIEIQWMLCDWRWGRKGHRCRRYWGGWLLMSITNIFPKKCRWLRCVYADWFQVLVNCICSVYFMRRWNFDSLRTDNSGWLNGNYINITFCICVLIWCFEE